MLVWWGSENLHIQQATWLTWVGEVECAETLSSHLPDQGEDQDDGGELDPLCSLSLPVSHLGASQAGHGLFQILSKVQDVLYRPLPLGLWICQREQEELGEQRGLPAGGRG